MTKTFGATARLRAKLGDFWFYSLMLFVAYLPTEWVQFLSAHNINSLSTMLWWMTGVNVIQLSGCMIAMLRQNPGCIQ